MTPFGQHLEKIRRSRGLQQSQLAAGIGVNPCYVSAMEKGRKGPAAKPVLERMVTVLDLDEMEARQFWESVRLSQRTRTVPENTSVEEYVLLDRFWQSLGTLSPEQIQGIELFLKVGNEGRKRYRAI